jgi:putative FmdB family regulatory protein
MIMPIYEYKCEACGHQLEAFQKITENPLTECPSCHKAGLNKLISATSFQLKGTGWYATDFKDKGKPKKANPEEGGSQSSDAKESTSTDSSKESTSSTANASTSKESNSSDSNAKPNDKAAE